ncbi:hypothetical protein ISCGN_004436 [Ixodes scapularis]
MLARFFKVLGCFSGTEKRNGSLVDFVFYFVLFLHVLFFCKHVLFCLVVTSMALYFYLLVLSCLLPLYLQGTNLFILLKFVNSVPFTFCVLSTHLKILGVPILPEGQCGSEVMCTYIIMVNCTLCL